MILFCLFVSLVCAVGGKLLDYHDHLEGFNHFVANTLWIMPLISAYSCYEFMGRQKQALKHESTFSSDATASDKKGAPAAKPAEAPVQKSA